jgi:hypothetical protein
MPTTDATTASTPGYGTMATGALAARTSASAL